MAQGESKFDIWWNSPSVKRLVGMVYSLGASVVIIGAMFKILHLPGAATVLGIGMTVEACLFALGVFDKPHKEYEWHKVFDFEGNEVGEMKEQVASDSIQSKKSFSQTTSVGNISVEIVSDDDITKLSEGIKNLTTTANQFANLSTVIGATDKFAKTLDGASIVTSNYIQGQEILNNASNKLVASYTGVADNMEEVVKNTKVYAGKVDDVTKSLSSINSIYEIQLRKIQDQAEALTQQTEQVRLATNHIESVVADTQRIKASASVAAAETEKYKEETLKLSKQIADLNQVYGNMLNALS